MTKEEAKEAIKEAYGTSEYTDEIIKALSAKPQGNSISREAVLNTLENMDKALDENRTIEAYKDLLRECFKELPPIEPQGDLISREAVNNVIETFFEEAQPYSLSWKWKNELKAKVNELLIVEPQGWISVKDRLPNDECECWITLEYIKTGNRVLYESHYDLELEKFYNQKNLEREGYKLIAWQKKRMPSPYKGE